jgi:GT2 family glycosyltransferase
VSEPDLSVVIVSWNVRDLLRDCLRSLRESPDGLDVEIVVVDNASTDRSAAMVREEFPGVKLVELMENTGYAAANNRGIEASAGRYVLALNPDVLVKPGALGTIVEKLDAQPRVAAVGPLNLDENDRVRASARRFPTITAMLYQHTLLRLAWPLRAPYREYKMRDFRWDRELAVDQPMGAALAVRRSALKEVGGWDEGFFMYFEEVDLCRRIKDRGGEILFLPQSRIVHLGGRSTAQVRSKKQMMIFRSMFRYFDQHESALKGRCFRWTFKLLYVLTSVVRLPLDVLTALVQTAGGRTARTRRQLAAMRETCLFLVRDVWGFLWM